MVSLTVSHVKVEVDLTQPLPAIVEYERENGEVVEVSVHYPWVPPTCSHCHELGHIIRNCLHYTPPPPSEPPLQDKPKGKKASSSSTPVSKSTRQIYRKKAVDAAASVPTAILNTDEMMIDKARSTIGTSDSKSLGTFDPCLTPAPTPRPSLKRSRSSPTLSPPYLLQLKPQPFCAPTSTPTLQPATFVTTSPSRHLLSLHHK